MRYDIAAVVAVVALVGACAPADRASDDPGEQQETDALASCRALAEERTSLSDLAQEPLREVLASVPELAPVAEALLEADPDGEALGDQPVTVLAPIDGLEVADRTEEEDAEARRAGDDALRAEEFVVTHVHVGEALSAEELLEAGEVEMEDGSTVEVRAGDEDSAQLARLGEEAELVCADIPTAEGVIHVISRPLASQDQVREDDEDADDQEPRSEGDQPGERGLAPDVDEELDEASNGDEGADSAD